MNDQTVKKDAGKIRPTLVDTNLIRSAAVIEEYDSKAEDCNAPMLLYKTRKAGQSWKGMFECPYCGTQFEAFIGNVTRGKTRSCGCMKGKFIVEARGTHGATKTRLYTIWRHILERCNSPSCKQYKWYGARGIKCEFKTFEDFRDHALETGYRDDLTCERIDVNKNYAPGNITWIPREWQPRNMRSNVMITYKGLTLCAGEWAEILGINADTLTSRKRKGWDDKRTIETVVKDSPDISLVPDGTIAAIIRARRYGVTKYKDPENWKRVDKQRYKDAVCRHMLAYLDDPNGVDEESGLSHLDHLITDVAFLIALEDEEATNDSQGISERSE